MTTKISQKEYLKKYLSSEVGGIKKKKKKKSKSNQIQTVKIIDDDFNICNNATEADLEIYAMGEDAPQIVGVIDDRPPELIAVEDYKKSYKWKSLTSDNKTDCSLNTVKLDNIGSKSKEILRCTKVTRRYSSDESPPRRPSVKNESSKDKTKTRKPHTPSRFKDVSPDTVDNNSSILVKREQTTPDLSPKRRQNKRYSNGSDNSPPKKRHSNRKYETSSSSLKRRYSSDLSPQRYRRKRSNSSDLSPPRNRRKRSNSSDLSTLKHQSMIKKEKDTNLSKSSQRRGRSRTRSTSKERNHKLYKRNKRSSSYSPNSRRQKRYSLSPRPKNPREYDSYTNNSLDRASPQRERTIKSVKTLDGKTAGLQDAKALRIESDKFRKREAALFEQMSNEVSGRSADVVVRDRKTGRVRDLELESEREQEKMRKEEQRQQLYNRWGKGLKQMEEHKARIESDIHEYNKPLARYADDADLDELLKKQERDGDPMLEYLRSKEKTKKNVIPAKPIYHGTYPENRFGIRPGYRWDGVDRSNGYEVKWFNVQSQRKAGEEEAYKYSTEDM